MSKKRKSNETNLLSQPGTTDKTIPASVTNPTAPLSAFAAARAKVKLASSDFVVHDEVMQSIAVETTEEKKAKKVKKVKIAKLSPSRATTRRKEKIARLDRDTAVEEENVFSQLTSFSKHLMPEPYTLPERDHDHELNDVSEEETAEVATADTMDDDRIVQMSSWTLTTENCVHGETENQRILMNNGETLSVCGHYRLQVHEGLIIIAANSLLTNPRASKNPPTVAYLDLDQNKQEYGPPGQISLVVVKHPNLKPRFTRSMFDDGGNKVLRAHAIRLNGHKEDMEHYLNAVHDLLQHYRALNTTINQGATLIVNCPFWFQASGYDLTVNLTRTLKPSQVLCFASGPAKVIDWIQNAAATAPVEKLSPQPFFSVNKSPHTAAEVNEMHILSYFHSESSKKKAPRWHALPLAHRRPFDVSYREGNSDFAGIFIFGEVPVMYPNMLSTLLNGSLVSILAVEDTSILDTRKVMRGEDDCIPYFAVGPRGYSIPFEPSKSHVIGLGLIRGIDSQAQRLQIVTPVPARQIAEIPSHRLVLAFGGFESPGWAYLEETYYQEWEDGQVREEASFGVAPPWVEETYGIEDGKRVGGLGMQVWKTRRFQ
ncbi:hypothetical protein FKW77_003926 [Venturia effusa]|uniref:Polynucleotide 5'-hydroxyl-kinase GRC3 n=1 Tax=Venturia effusa TaxID=50376 RepID=A0A517L742_9PEZI|nr:hypothetical protein FKW77_003926 [Venturia effusa]